MSIPDHIASEIDFATKLSDTIECSDSNHMIAIAILFASYRVEQAIDRLSMVVSQGQYSPPLAKRKC